MIILSNKIIIKTSNKYDKLIYFYNVLWLDNLQFDVSYYLIFTNDTFTGTYLIKHNVHIELLSFGTVPDVFNLHCLYLHIS